MDIDLDLSAFRLVKSFAAVEISKNVGASGPDDVAGEPQADPVRPRDATVSAASAPSVQPGLSAAAGKPASPAVDQIPESLDDDMRAALDQGLEGAEREAVNWQYGQRNAALSLAGLARPGGSSDSRQSRSDASGQAVVHELDSADAAAVRAPIVRAGAESAPVQTNLVQGKQAASEQSPASSATAALPLAKTSSQPAILTATSTAVITDDVAVVDRATAAVPSDPSRANGFTTAAPFDAGRVDGGLEKPQFLLASTISLFGEAHVVDALQSMVDDQREDGPAAAASGRKSGKSGPVLLAAADELASQNAVMRDLVRLSRPSVGGPALEAGQVEVPGARSSDEEPLANQQRAAAISTAHTNIASRTVAAAAHKPELPDAFPFELSEAHGSQAISGEGPEQLDPFEPRLASDKNPSEFSGAAPGGKAAVTLVAVALRPDVPDMLPRQLAEGHGSQDISGEDAEQLDPFERGLVSDKNPSEFAGTAPAGKAAVAVPGATVLDILDALVALSASAGEGSEDWQSLSSVILNAAMIPGWPPPRPVENPASVKQGDMMAQSSQSADTEEKPMTPEQLLAYLVSIGANLRLLRALQELVSRVGKKDGPALLAWLAGLVSALKVIERSLKDIIEDGMDLPEWLAELSDAAKRRRRRKQFQI